VSESPEPVGGTGQVIARFNNNEIDIAIALTDPLLAGIAKGSTSYRLVGSYVTSPLRWAVITGKDSNYISIDDLRGTTLGISRQGRSANVHHWDHVVIAHTGFPVALKLWQG
jgi:ABC-type nitrate/sulfonate/bicarbonate transport system substrate-binding protein